MAVRLDEASEKCSLTNSELEKQLVTYMDDYDGERFPQIVIAQVCSLMASIRNDPGGWMARMESETEELIIRFGKFLEAILLQAV